ncbi:hypothetical protein ACLB2K_069941 [Fragaria x ananassa]
MKRSYDDNHRSPKATSNDNTSRKKCRATAEMKRKRIIRQRRFHGVDLFLELDGVVLLDSPTSDQCYQVVWWIEPDGEKHISDKVTGSPNPKWDKKWYVGLKGNPVGEDLFVNLEVLRYNSTKNCCDPGTSDDPSIGEVIRARVPFPKRLEDTIQGRYELVKPDGAGNMRIAGDIDLTMSLETWTKDYYRWTFS